MKDSKEANNNKKAKAPSAEFLMMRHIFGATAIPLPPQPTNYSTTLGQRERSSSV